jgi:hypothetical protein
VPFGCDERHPLPVVLAPCSASLSCNLCDDLAQTFNDDGTGRKVRASSKHKTQHLCTKFLPTPFQSMPLLPVATWGCKLWVAVDGRAIDRRTRCSGDLQSSYALFLVLTHNVGTRGIILPLSCTTVTPTCLGASILAAHAPASACTLPSAVTRSRCSSTCPSLRRVCPGMQDDLCVMQSAQAVTHIGLLGQQAEVEFMQVNGGSCNINRRWRGWRGMRNLSLLKTVVDPESLGWVTSFSLYDLPCACHQSHAVLPWSFPY